MSNINTFGSMKKREVNQSSRSNGSSSDDEGQQAFYAGGSERSGQQVLGPPGAKKTPNQLISDMFKSAREAGAQVLDRSSADAEPNQAQRVPFSGAGYSLSSNTESGSTNRSPSPGHSSAERCVRRLKMWRNGFSIDEGELRNYNDPSNTEFLACIQRGEVPRELIVEAHGGEVNLNMEDHRFVCFILH
jgi:UBX domain-containing protein 1